MLWLLAWATLIRLPIISSGTLLFGFDHGRDALTVLNFIKTLNPVFVGPPTSIPGLFVGPGWYYFLAPAYWLGQGNPLAAAYLMFIVFLAAIVLAYKYLGFYEAAIITTAPMWTQLSTGSQSPHPIPLIALTIVILLKKLLSAKKISPLSTILLGLILGLGFHFSSAVTIFYLLLVSLVLIWRRIKINWFRLGGAIFFTFIPQLLFELKHNFSQTHAVINYFSHGESQHLTPGKIAIVTQSIFHELGLAVLPDISWLKIIGLAILLVGIVYVIKQKKFGFWPEILILTLIPTIGFWWLHYNPWYSYGLLPLAVVAAGKILRSLPKPLAFFYLLLLVVNSGYKITRFFTYEKGFLNTHKGFLPAKMQALDYVYSQAAGQPFASYHYHPEIYDYAYQYLYIWRAFKGNPLPVEFSYQPGAPTYINEKADLLAKLPQSSRPAQTIFLIIEKPDNVYHYSLDSWLEQIKYSEVVDKKIIGLELEVWEVRP